MGTLNTGLWAAGLALQFGLLARLLVGGGARSLPVFAGLIGFYLLRSVLLYSVFGHLSGSGYASAYTLLAVLDLLLQAGVAWELLSASPRNGIRGAAAFLLLLPAAAACAWGLGHAVPATPRSPMDREVLFTSFLMIGVGLSVRWSGLPADFRRVLGGFLTLAVVGVLSQVGRALAAFHRDAHTFFLWSYANAFTYLLVLVFWLARLRGGEPSRVSVGAASGRTSPFLPR